MTDKKYESVRMPSEGTFKFIVFETDEGPKLRGGWEEYHSDIARTVRRTEGIEGRISGGGRIRATKDEIYAYGYSGSYGEPSQETVEDLLNKFGEKNGYKIKVEIGKGY